MRTGNSNPEVPQTSRCSGGSMFVALFDEVSDMLTQVEIVLIDP